MAPVSASTTMNRVVDARAWASFEFSWSTRCGLSEKSPDGAEYQLGPVPPLRFPQRHQQLERPGEVADRLLAHGYSDGDVEKILAEGERLHDDWGVDGTTGYEFMNQVSLLQHDPDGRAPLCSLWSETAERWYLHSGLPDPTQRY